MKDINDIVITDTLELHNLSSDAILNFVLCQKANVVFEGLRYSGVNTDAVLGCIVIKNADVFNIRFGLCLNFNTGVPTFNFVMRTNV